MPRKQNVNGKKNEFTLERVLKIEGKVVVSQHINGSCESNCNVSLKSDNVLSAYDEDLVNILANLGETEINISRINENSNDMNNAEPGRSSTTTSVTTDEPSINMATLTDEGRISGAFCSKAVFNISHKIRTETEIKVLEKRLDFGPIQRTLNSLNFVKALKNFVVE